MNKIELYALGKKAKLGDQDALLQIISEKKNIIKNILIMMKININILS